MREEAFTRNIPPGHEPARLRAVPVPAGTRGIEGIRPCRDGPARGQRLLLFCKRSPLGMHAAARTRLPVSRDRYRGRHGAHQPGHHRETGYAPDRKRSRGRGLRTIARIREIATQLGLEPARIHVVFNRYKSGAAPVDIGNENPIAIIPEDPAVEAADLAATPVSQIPETSPARQAVRGLAGKLIKMAHERAGE